MKWNIFNGSARVLILTGYGINIEILLSMSKNELLKLKVNNLILSLILGNYSVVNNEYEEGIKPVLNEVIK